MNLFMETYFRFIALFITVLTSVIFIIYMVLRTKIEINDESKLNIFALILVSIYEGLQIAMLVFTATNTILKLYTIFLIVSLVMLFFAEFIYIFSYLRLKNKFEKERIAKIYND